MLRIFARAFVGDGHVRAGAPESQGDLAANAPGSAGDECSLSVEKVVWHRWRSVLTRRVTALRNSRQFGCGWVGFGWAGGWAFGSAGLSFDASLSGPADGSDEESPLF